MSIRPRIATAGLSEYPRRQGSTRYKYWAQIASARRCSIGRLFILSRRDIADKRIAGCQARRDWQVPSTLVTGPRISSKPSPMIPAIRIDTAGARRRGQAGRGGNRDVGHWRRVGQMRLRVVPKGAMICFAARLMRVENQGDMG